jgi:hypothetical protein
VTSGRWPDARLDLDQSVRRINQQYPDFRKQTIKEFLIHWIQEIYDLEKAEN